MWKLYLFKFNCDNKLKKFHLYNIILTFLKIKVLPAKVFAILRFVCLSLSWLPDVSDNDPEFI